MTVVPKLSPAMKAKLRERAFREGFPEEEIVLRAVEKLLDSAEQPPKHRRSVLEFRGVCKHNSVGKDAQEYINEMRDEWDRTL